MRQLEKKKNPSFEVDAVKTYNTMIIKVNSDDYNSGWWRWMKGRMDQHSAVMAWLVYGGNFHSLYIFTSRHTMHKKVMWQQLAEYKGVKGK